MPFRTPAYKHRFNSLFFHIILLQYKTGIGDKLKNSSFDFDTEEMNVDLKHIYMSH